MSDVQPRDVSTTTPCDASGLGNPRGKTANADSQSLAEVCFHLRVQPSARRMLSVAQVPTKHSHEILPLALRLRRLGSFQSLPPESTAVGLQNAVISTSPTEAWEP